MLHRILAFAFIASGSIATAGCALMPSQIDPISVEEMGLVLREAKRQIGVYQYATQKLSPGVPSDPKLAREYESSDFVCGDGSINYEITSVTLGLTTQLTQSNSLSIQGSVPVNLATVGGSLSGALTRENSQELKYRLYPLNERPLTEADVELGKEAPIAAVLLNLRDASIISAHSKGACFRNFIPGKEAGDANTYKLALRVEKSVSGSFSIGLAPIAVSAGGETNSVTGNSMTITFSQVVRNQHRNQGVGVSKRKLIRTQGAPIPSEPQAWPALPTLPGYCPSGECLGIQRRGVIQQDVGSGPSR